MGELRGRLWQRALLSRLTEAERDDVDAREWLSELEAEEDAAQDEFRNVGVVFAQLSQVEVGVRSLAQGQRRSRMQRVPRPALASLPKSHRRSTTT